MNRVRSTAEGYVPGFWPQQVPQVECQTLRSVERTAERSATVDTEKACDTEAGVIFPAATPATAFPATYWVPATQTFKEAARALGGRTLSNLNPASWLVLLWNLGGMVVRSTLPEAWRVTLAAAGWPRSPPSLFFSI